MKKDSKNIGENKQEITLDEAGGFYFSNRSEENLEKVVRAGKKLIHYFIRLYGLDFPREDLLHAGFEGLMKALKRFNTDNGISFTTYAGCLIIGEIRHYVRKEVRYYYPQTVMKLQNKIDETIKGQLLKTGELPQYEEIGKMLNIRKDGICEVMRSGLVPIEEIDIRRIASIKHESFKLPIEERILLEQALKKLNDLQRKVIELIFYRDMTQEQTAKKLGINQRKVSRVKCASIGILRQTLLEKDGTNYI